MVTINRDIFLEQSADRNILDNVTKYCSKCYNEFSEQDLLYYDVENYNYLCKSCACCISEELQTNEECLLDECDNEASLF